MSGTTYLREWRSRNREHVNSYKREWARTNPDKISSGNFKQRHGLTREERDALLNEQGGCAICGTTVPNGRGDWHIDHDHNCCPGERHCRTCVRAVLCHLCNTGLGFFRDSPQTLRQAADYLDRKGYLAR